MWGKRTLIGWLLTEKIVSTKQGKPMDLMTLEDQTGMYDATVFPTTYRQYCHLLWHKPGVCAHWHV